MASVGTGITVLVMVAAGAACEETTDPAPRGDAGAREASSEIPDATSLGISFDPSQFPTECDRDSDCLLVSAITECTTCCTTTTSVNREPAERRYSEVVGACGGELMKCKAACEPLIAHCDARRCVAR